MGHSYNPYNYNFPCFNVELEIIVFKIRVPVGVRSRVTKLDGYNFVLSDYFLPALRPIHRLIMDTGELSNNIRKAISREVKAAIVSTQHDMLNSITTAMDVKLTSFQNSIQQSQAETSQNQISKIEETLCDNYVFQRKGNENQFKHASKVMTKLKDAKTHLENPDLNFECVTAAKTKIEEGMELIKERQKMIKLADSNELGWRVVNEYVTNPIADDSDDEKRMARAQAKAEKKFKAEKLRKSRNNRNAPYVRSTDKKDDRPKTRSGRCFNCGKKGHWADECPEKKSKISSLSNLYSFNYLHSFQSTTSLSDLHKSTEHKSSDMCIAKSKQIQSCDNTIISPVGRLKSNIDRWKLISSNDHVIDIVQNGYKIPFKTEPEDVFISNNKSAIDNPQFVESEITNLLNKGCISEVFTKPKVVNPLTVAYNKNGKPRMVLDCRHINPHLFKFRFKYEDSATARELFDGYDFLFGYDLKSAYHHIQIFSQCRQYLGFSWKTNNLTKFYVFNVLPFGISTAGYIFTKVTREVVKYFRSQGMRVVMFLDDGLGGSNDFESCLTVSQKVKLELESLGFLLAHEKCNWEPSQNIQWLGYIWNTKEGKILVSEDRINRVETKINDILQKVSNGRVLFYVRTLASIVGQLISMYLVLGNIVRFKTRYLYFCILSKASWNAPVTLTQLALNELFFWNEHCRILNRQGVSFRQESLGSVCDAELFTDASDLGFGGYLLNGIDSHIESPEISGSWVFDEQIQSSTWRELEGANRILHHFAPAVKT